MADLEARVAALEAVVPKMIPRVALDLFVADQHRFGSRPCGTCRQISNIIGEPWGCSAYGQPVPTKEPDREA